MNWLLAIIQNHRTCNNYRNEYGWIFDVKKLILWLWWQSFFGYIWILLSKSSLKLSLPEAFPEWYSLHFFFLPNITIKPCIQTKSSGKDCCEKWTTTEKTLKHVGIYIDITIYKYKAHNLQKLVLFTPVKAKKSAKMHPKDCICPLLLSWLREVSPVLRQEISSHCIINRCKVQSLSFQNLLELRWQCKRLKSCCNFKYKTHFVSVPTHLLW